MTSFFLNICQWLIMIGIVLSQDTDNCINSRGRNGKCVPIDLCPELLDIARKSQVSVQEMEFLTTNNCGKAVVCCEQYTEVTKSRRMTLPGVGVCGFGHASEKILGGTETELEQYRWMVVIERIENGDRELICGGALINTLYVLSAAHCIKNDQKPENLVLRLGEHDLSSDPDCDSSGNCNNRVILANVSGIIIHPNYRKERNDVALLKLAKPIEYSNYVLPICLPVLPAHQEDFIGRSVFAAGWGRNGTGEELSEVKMHVELQIVQLEECENLFSRSAPGEMHVCARSATEEIGDTCEGDSGGPLMIELQGTWFQIGIVNFGFPCGTAYPAVYARTAHFIDWIQENLLE
ncbi:AAEL000760-PA [Aedes aegypti]|uniref:CLIP domain-containing serine protease n=1 Tax=Aedes aegypti TaxID=7159 RepID=Q17N99_AEDAE|nr:AAEL000760-PA [Aedes aegypti]